MGAKVGESPMWAYGNPVRVQFGSGCFGTLTAAIGRRRYAVVTYPEAMFANLVAGLEESAGKLALLIDDVAPNPDQARLREQSGRFANLAQPVELIVAIGGGSVIDSAKVFAAAAGDFDQVRRHLERQDGGDGLSAIPIIAVPTTAGTGSEVTCWATVWDRDAGRKFSLAQPGLYPEMAIVDPALMLDKPRGLTLATGLDALSHALESIWNVNANPVSLCFAEVAAREMLECLPILLGDLQNLDLRTRAAKASLFAGLAFSNTKTALAHNLSYPMTLEYGVQHGIACSFTLPVILESVVGLGGIREASLQAIFGTDLRAASWSLQRFLSDLGVPVRLEEHGVPVERWSAIVDAAFVGERGRNFVGERSRFDAAASCLGLV
jgi:phosphonate metabolism-associated iron-containing alcohol dehydrogenase